MRPLTNMTQEQPESSETPVKASPAPETAGNSKPVFGASGRKIVYDKDGKPYVLPLESSLCNY